VNTLGSIKHRVKALPDSFLPVPTISTSSECRFLIESVVVLLIEYTLGGPMKTQVRVSGWAVTSCRCRILLGDIVLEAFNYVCMIVVAGCSECFQPCYFDEPIWLWPESARRLACSHVMPPLFILFVLVLYRIYSQVVFHCCIFGRS
jgi:hypothetical protein